MTALLAGSATKRGAGYYAAVIAGFAVFGLIVGVVIWKLLTAGAFAARRWTVFTEWITWRFLLQGYVVNLRAGAIAGGLAMTLGLVLGLGRLSRSWFVRWPATLWIETFRSLPLFYLIFFSAVFFPRYTGWQAPILWYGIVGLVVYNSAVLAEIVRAGVLSLDRGQREAAVSLGLSYWEAMRHVLLPQALRRMVPALVSQVITLLKDTSLLYIIGVFELVRRGRALQSSEGNPFQTYFVIGMMFLVVNLVLSQLSRRLEVRQRQRYGAGAITVAGVEDLTALDATAKAK